MDSNAVTLRPRKTRQAARVIVVAEDKYLLGERWDPAITGRSWWATAGGGIDPGENAIEAAIREVSEELGVDVTSDILGKPVATRLATLSYSDQIVDQQETYFVWQAKNCFAAETRFQTEREKATAGDWRWFTEAELSQIWVWDDVVAIAKLAAISSKGAKDLGHDIFESVPLS